MLKEVCKQHIIFIDIGTRTAVPAAIVFGQEVGCLLSNFEQERTIHQELEVSIRFMPQINRVKNLRMQLIGRDARCQEHTIPHGIDCATLERTSTTASWAPSRSSGGAAATRHAAVRWHSNPQGAPSGVCTGHKKPQDSGSNFRTVVVGREAKYAPR